MVPGGWAAQAGSGLYQSLTRNSNKHCHKCSRYQLCVLFRLPQTVLSSSLPEGGRENSLKLFLSQHGCPHPRQPWATGPSSRSMPGPAKPEQWDRKTGFPTSSSSMSDPNSLMIEAVFARLWCNLLTNHMAGVRAVETEG